MMRFYFFITLLFLIVHAVTTAAEENPPQSLHPRRNGKPMPLLNFRIKPNKTTTTTTAAIASNCKYTAVITTSCSSPSYTRDYISISFGDAYGNQVYVPRLDNPASHAFDRCSKDTFHIDGPCTYDICYLYLLRRGYDGWKPGYVQIYGNYTRAVHFTFNTFVPDNVWYGFNYCYGGGGGSERVPVM